MCLPLPRGELEVRSKERGQGQPPMFVVRAAVDVPVPCGEGQRYAGRASMNVNLPAGGKSADTEDGQDDDEAGAAAAAAAAAAPGGKEGAGFSSLSSVSILST